MTGRSLARSPAGTALAEGHWLEARDAFLAELAESETGGAFEGLAQAMWWLDDGTRCLEARERGYRAHRVAGDDVGAGRTAAALAYDSLLFGEGEAVARGWLARAAALLQGAPTVAEHGWLAVREAELALATRQDPAIAQTAAERASAVGLRVHDEDLVHVATALSGLARVVAGRPAQGMPLLDSAAAAATAGEIADLMWMGKVVCWLIVGCQETSDLTRAEEWCRRVETICRRRHLEPLFTVCRIQRSSVLIARGVWSAAERDLTEAMDSSATSRRHARLDAVIQLGELRRRQGRDAEAEALLRQAEFDPVAIVSLAHIQLARGQVDAAWAAIRALLATTPAESRLARARLLLPAVRMACAAGDREAARTAAAELQDIAAHGVSSALSAMSEAAVAILAEGDASHEHWRAAVRHFHAAQLPLEEAESRLGLARALRDAGDAAAGAEQRSTAMRDLEALGAVAALAEEARTCSATGRAADDARAGLLTEREIQVLRMVAGGSTNPQIADALVLSPHTVHRHVANILIKLEQPTRAAAVAHAASNGWL